MKNKILFGLILAAGIAVFYLAVVRRRPVTLASASAEARRLAAIAGAPDAAAVARAQLDEFEATLGR